MKTFSRSSSLYLEIFLLFLFLCTKISGSLYALPFLFLESRFYFLKKISGKSKKNVLILCERFFIIYFFCFESFSDFFLIFFLFIFFLIIYTISPVEKKASVIRLTVEKKNHPIISVYVFIWI